MPMKSNVNIIVQNLEIINQDILSYIEEFSDRTFGSLLR
jgi:hypothetical protein